MSTGVTPASRLVPRYIQNTYSTFSSSMMDIIANNGSYILGSPKCGTPGPSRHVLDVLCNMG